MWFAAFASGMRHIVALIKNKIHFTRTSYPVQNLKLFPVMEKQWNQTKLSNDGIYT